MINQHANEYFYKLELKIMMKVGLQQEDQNTPWRTFTLGFKIEPKL